MPLPSTALPATRTLHFARPGTNTTNHNAYTVYDTPGCRASDFGHRLVAHLPPEPHELASLAEAWRATNAGKGLSRGWIGWESRERWPHEAPDGFALGVYRCLMCDEALEAAPDPAIRPLGRGDLPALVDLFVASEGEAEREAYTWFVERLLERVEADRGFAWGAWDGGRLAGTVSVLFDGREARLQGVITHPDHRRRGVCTALVRHAVQSWQDVSFGITYVVAEDGSGAEALYRRLGFRAVTWEHWLGFAP